MRRVNGHLRQHGVNVSVQARYGATSGPGVTLLFTTACGGSALEASANQGAPIGASPEPNAAAEADDPASEPEADKTPAVNAFVAAAHDYEPPVADAEHPFAIHPRFELVWASTS